MVTQALVAALVTILASAYSRTAALSALAGGGAASLAIAIFAGGVFGPYRADKPGRLVARFYGAELLKLLTVLLIFGAAFAWIEPLEPLVLFGAFLLVQVLPLLLANRVAR